MAIIVKSVDVLTHMEFCR